jgi:uncharacterized protein YdeI (BOF family)
MKLVPIIALAALVATPAFAGQAKKKKTPLQPQGYYQQHGDWRASSNQQGGNYINGPHVYSPSGRYIGSDPSLNVRQHMYDEDFRFRNGT